MKKENEFLATAKLTSKGQITIPKIVRETLKLDEGDSVFFYVDKNNNIKISNTKDCKIETDNNKEQIVVKRGNKNE
ncbi:MAG: AbrB/MazE/SpoVT family DNA-binding domain-containing protein [Bacilli bacterium]|nr:AbrB/MazE/SpoVT family DNA-binding domain-containing protein [Bacilli bacterium]